MIVNPVVVGGNGGLVWKEATLIQTRAPNPGANFNYSISFSKKPQVVLMYQEQLMQDFNFVGALFDTSLSANDGHSGASNYASFYFIDYSWNGSTLNFTIHLENASYPLYCASVG